MLGSAEDQVTLVFRYEESTTSGLWAVLYDAARNGDGEIQFSAPFRTAAIGNVEPWLHRRVHGGRHRHRRR